MAAMPRLISVKEAARRMRTSEAEVRELIEAGHLIAGETPRGKLLVVDSAEDERKASAGIPREQLPEYKKFAQLRGHPISLSEAAEKYGISFSTIHGWSMRGFIDRLGRRGREVLLDEQQVAYCVEIARQRPGGGKWLFNPDGTPYTPKN